MEKDILMRNFIAAIFMLLGYTFIYTGVSKFWFGVTASPVSIGKGG